MFLLISSGDLLMFYLSLELDTILVAAMANFDLTKKSSSGILLVGISLAYGATGGISFAEIPQQLVDNSSLIYSTGSVIY